MWGLLAVYIGVCIGLRDHCLNRRGRLIIKDKVVNPTFDLVIVEGTSSTNLYKAMLLDLYDTFLRKCICLIIMVFLLKKR